MQWIELTDEEQLNRLKILSEKRNQVIFKHSTRCSVSSMALHRLEKETPPDDTDFYFLDLLRYRDLSDTIAADFEVYHESPQVLLISKGVCIYEESHSGIRMSELLEQIHRN
ncbi:MAG: bacillithiol system redox-active protein YtxJ [Chitinophagaceae bacterium]|nr:bacillithiol system redox-active protein YtxJ [Chitinophagaceae bacterium]